MCTCYVIQLIANQRESLYAVNCFFFFTAQVSLFSVAILCRNYGVRTVEYFENHSKHSQFSLGLLIHSVYI